VVAAGVQTGQSSLTTGRVWLVPARLVTWSQGAVR
jgi:hypothetical protein